MHQQVVHMLPWDDLLIVTRSVSTSLVYCMSFVLAGYVLLIPMFSMVLSVPVARALYHPGTVHIIATKERYAGIQEETPGRY